MMERPFQFLASFDLESGLAFDLVELLLGHQAGPAERLAGEQLDLQPSFEFVFLAPDPPHFDP